MKMYQNFQQLANALQQNVAHSFQHNLSQALDEIGDETKAEMESRIGNYPQNQGKAPAFPALAQSTLDQKAKKGWGLNGNPNSPNYATGAFQRSIGVTRNGSKFVVIGTDLKYVQYTEMGTSKMPPRPVMQPSADYVIKRFLPRLQQLSAAGIVAVPVSGMVIK